LPTGIDASKSWLGTANVYVPPNGAGFVFALNTARTPCMPDVQIPSEMFPANGFTDPSGFRLNVSVSVEAFFRAMIFVPWHNTPNCPENGCLPVTMISWPEYLPDAVTVTLNCPALRVRTASLS